MAGRDEQLISADGATLFESVEWVAPKSETPRWLPAGATAFIQIGGGEVRLFFERWVIPLLNEYETALAFVDGYERGDERLVMVQPTYVYVAAAYVVLSAHGKAREVVAKKFNGVGLRKRYASVFEYLERGRDKLLNDDGAN